MKILYVTPLVRGFEDILKGDTESKGLPTFILPLKELLLLGHQVEIILVSNYRDHINIKVDWIKEESIIANINHDLVNGGRTIKLINTIKSFKNVFLEVKKAIKREHYDLIYCHGTAAVVGNIAANIYKVPCAYRLYGTFQVYGDIKKEGNFIAAIKNYKYFLIFKLKKEFLLITDDGSHGDKVYARWRRKKYDYPLYFWINGVNVEDIHDLDNAGMIPQEDYLFMAGRVETCKGQKKGIEILLELHKKGIFVHLYLAGHIDNDEYYCELKNFIEQNNIMEYVHFMGPISREYLKQMSYHAKAMLLWQSVANNGSVFYETFSTGALIVALDDGSLERFVTKDRNIFLVKDVKEAAQKVEVYMNLSDVERSKMKTCAIEQAKATLQSWDDRIAKEIDLLTLDQLQG